MGGTFTLRLTDGQKKDFNQLFSNLFTRSELSNGSEMSSSVARLAINICRIMEVVAMLRALEQGEITRSPNVSPDPGTILSFLPATQVTSRGNADRDALVQCMGERFTRAEFIHRAEEMGIKPETASTWLKRLQKHGLVESTDRNGTYRKPGKR